MVIQIILTLGLLFALLYGVLQRSSTRLLRAVLYLVVLFGIYFVWFPKETSVLARMVGVGRGTDLLLYCWTIIGIVLILNLQLRINRLERRLTDLVRDVAITRAESPNLRDNPSAE